MEDFNQGARLPVVAQSRQPAPVRDEVDRQVATAHQFPRNLPTVIANITMLATLDEETAQECLYALVRGQKRNNRDGQGDDRENKPIEGPSIRLAEIAAQCFGNCRIEARVTEVNRAEKYVEAEGIFLDLETNMASRATNRRRISTRSGGLFSDDMILVTGNAACAIAKRNAILAGIPRGLYRQAYQQARAMVAGTAETLVSNRAKAINAFSRFGVKADQILEVLGLESDAEITLDHIATLRAMFSTLKNGEASVEEMFSKAGPADFAKVVNPLGDDEPPARGINAAAAAADKIIAPDGTVLKDRDGEAGAKVDPVEEARKRGAAAYAAKMTKRALPAEYREEGRQAEGEAWLAGWTGAKADAAVIAAQASKPAGGSDADK